MQSNSGSTRRGFLKQMLVLGGSVALAACAPKTESPDAPAGAAVGQAVPAVPAGQSRVTIRIQTPARPNTIPMMNKTIEEYMEKNPHVEVLSEETIYDEIATKTETGYISDTLQDLCYGHHRWYAYGCYMGIYMPIDDYIQTSPPDDFADFFQAPLEDNKFEGKQYSLPHFVHPGSNILMLYNKNILAEAGVDEPTRDWTYEDLAEMARKCTDKDKGIWGASWGMKDFHRYGQFTRSWGQNSWDDKSFWLLSEDGKTFRFTDTEEPAKFYLDLRKSGVIPGPQDEITGTMGLFGAGMQAFLGGQVQSMRVAENTVQGQFEIGWQVRPLGPNGRESTCNEGNMWMINSKSKHPDVTWDFMKAVTSTESAVFGILEGGLQPGRKSAWVDPRVLAELPVYETAAEIIEGGLEAFPMPWNLRFGEANTVFNNEVDALWSLEMTWEQHAAVVQQRVQDILNLDRP